jgi:hypothetical protein
MRHTEVVCQAAITGRKTRVFRNSGSNFFERPVELSEAGCKKDIGILVAQHSDLRHAVAQLGSRIEELDPAPDSLSRRTMFIMPVNPAAAKALGFAPSSALRLYFSATRSG